MVSLFEEQYIEEHFPYHLLYPNTMRTVSLSPENIISCVYNVVTKQRTINYINFTATYADEPQPGDIIVGQPANFVPFKWPRQYMTKFQQSKVLQHYPHGVYKKHHEYRTKHKNRHY